MSWVESKLRGWWIFKHTPGQPSSNRKEVNQMPLMRVGRIVLNTDKIVKAVCDRNRTTTIHLEGGVKAVFSKHAVSAFSKLKALAR